jgi:glycosyltransferase involved in cell wall biosynthesis
MQNYSPKVSIITPVYNGSATIEEAIQSLLLQILPNWELIIIDDGSTDNTSEIINKIKDPRICYFHQENQGRSIARNNGISHSNGEYLLFLDADDWLLPNALQDHVAILDSNPKYGVSVSDGYFCDYHGNKIIRISERRSPVTSGNVLEKIIVEPGIIGGSLLAMVRKQIITAHGIKFDETLSIGEDWLFWIEIAQLTEFSFIDSITGMYRWYPENTSNSVKENFRNNQLFFIHKKIIASEYFSHLPIHVKDKFYYRLLVEILQNMHQEQSAIIDSSSFQALPKNNQAKLIRLVASEYILSSTHFHFVQKLIGLAINKNPTDLKTYLVWVTLINPGFAKASLQLRRSREDRKDLSKLI